MRFLITVLIFCVPLSSFAQDFSGLLALKTVIQESGHTCDNISKIGIVDKDLANSVDRNTKNIWIVSCKSNRKGNRDYTVYEQRSNRRFLVCDGLSQCREWPKN